MIVILTMMLVVGGIFILLPLKLFRQKEDSFLRIDESQSTKDIQAIIMFVGTLNIKKGLGIETLLPYKVLMQMSKGPSSVKKFVWLLHGPIDQEPGSSYGNAGKLAFEFRSEQMSINSIVIDDIFNDVSAFFAEVDKVFTEKNKGIPLRDIVCDCTGGQFQNSLSIWLNII